MGDWSVTRYHHSFSCTPHHYPTIHNQNNNIIPYIYIYIYFFFFDTLSLIYYSFRYLFIYFHKVNQIKPTYHTSSTKRHKHPYISPKFSAFLYATNPSRKGHHCPIDKFRALTKQNLFLRVPHLNSDRGFFFRIFSLFEYFFESPFLGLRFSLTFSLFLSHSVWAAGDFLLFWGCELRVICNGSSSFL